MAIYRGPGGAGDATADATSTAALALAAANEAEASATSAASSATAAANSATAADTSADEAATSATNAAGSATTASTAATNASTYATNASTSASNASTSATAAASSASSASSSASAASTSASNASTSASNASSSASTASTQATNASNSASSASTSATNAASSATAAAASATLAASYTPSQTSNSGKFLTTDGTSTSWGTVAYSALTGTVPTWNQNTTGSAATATTATNVSGGTASVTTLTTSSTVTLNGGTANGVTYLNGSKVLTSGSGFVFDGTNVGIGTSSPTTKLYINTSGAYSGATVTSDISTTALASRVALGNSVGSARFTINMLGGGGEVGYLGSEGNFPIYFQTNGTERARIDTSGNLGIGTTSPSTRLHAKGSGGTIATFERDASGTIAYFNRNTGGGNVGAIIGADSVAGYFAGGNSTSNMVYLDSVNNLAQFFTNNTERARIDSSGNFLVGKTTSADGTVGAVMQSTGRLAGAMAQSTSGFDTLTVYSTTASAYRFYVTMDGKINCTSTTIAGISDVRFKENIRDLDTGLSSIMALKPRKFDWKEGIGKNIKNDRGFIAQEFETVFPDLIGEWKDKPPEGEEPYKTVSPDLIPVLVKAIQEQQAIIESLKARLDAANL